MTMDLAVLDRLHERVIALPSHDKLSSTIYHSLLDSALHYSNWRKRQSIDPSNTGLEVHVRLESKKDPRLSSIIKFYDLHFPARAKKVFSKEYLVPFGGAHSWTQAAEMFKELIVGNILSAKDCKLVYGTKHQLIPLVTAHADENLTHYKSEFRSFDNSGNNFIDAVVEEFRNAHEEIIPPPSRINSRGHIKLVYSKQ